MDRNWPNIEEIATCAACGRDLDFRDYGRHKTCFNCRVKEKEKERKQFLQSLTLLSLEERLSRLEELFTGHEDRHPSKELWG